MASKHAASYLLTNDVELELPAKGRSRQLSSSFIQPPNLRLTQINTLVTHLQNTNNPTISNPELITSLATYDPTLPSGSLLTAFQYVGAPSLQWQTKQLPSPRPSSTPTGPTHLDPALFSAPTPLLSPKSDDPQRNRSVRMFGI